MTRPLTPAEAKAKLIALHNELGNFQVYLAHRTFPPCWESEENTAVANVLELIEEETAKMGRLERQKTMDNIVIDALKREGFEPDGPETPPGDSK